MAIHDITRLIALLIFRFIFGSFDYGERNHMNSGYEITGHTRLIGLLGSPVGHSKSPMMHNEAFRALGLDYRYLAFDVTEETLPRAVEGLKALGARGTNLTMPCKSRAVSLCDRLSPAARISGAVNTLVFEDDGTITGHTTDGSGFFLSCQEEGFQIPGKKMTIFGTGGAGTAIFVQAALDGAREISIFSRSTSSFQQRTSQVIAELEECTKCSIHVYDYEEQHLRRELAASHILVNATNVGMAPKEEESLIPDSSYFHPGLLVADIIYNPVETRLVKMAKEAGCQAFGGLYMLLYQGAESFCLWMGQEMPIEIVKKKCFSSP